MNLNEVFDEANISESDVDRLIYSKDSSELEGNAKMIVWPKTADELQKFISYIKRNDIPISIRGAGTSSRGQVVPDKGIVVDMSKLNNILEVGENYAIVQAGVVLDDLNKELESKGMFFPIIPHTHKVCTIGGMIASNSLGLHTSFGRVREYVLELEVVDATGKYLKMNRFCVNNFIGLEGSTGAIISAKLKIIPKKLAESISIVKFNSITSLVENAIRAKKMGNVLSVEYFDEKVSSLLGWGENLHIMIEYKDTMGNIKENIEEVLEVKEKIRYILYKNRYTQIEDPFIPEENLAKFLYWLEKNDIACFGHIGIGVLHPCFKEFSKQSAEMHEKLELFDGRVSGEFGFGIKHKNKMLKAELERVKELHFQLDPKKLLSRGKIYG